MSERKTIFVDLMLPLPLRNVFTYRVPFEINESVTVGQRVIVPFGKNKRITGIIAKIHENPPTLYQAKYVDYILDENPIIHQTQLVFWNWISSYYLSPIGDVMNAALPANFKLASETIIVIHPEFEFDRTELDEKEKLIISTLAHREKANLVQLAEVIAVKNIQWYIKRLIDKKAVITQEEINQRYIPKTITFAYLNPSLSAVDLDQIIDGLSQKERTQEQMLALLKIRQLMTQVGLNGQYIEKKRLIQESISNSTLNSLAKKGFILVERFSVDRLQKENTTTEKLPMLTEAQQNAFREINAQWSHHDIVLLNGITGSGKTEIYIHHIQKALENKQQVLFLIPEIALTTQLIQRLERFFGKKIGVYHSRFNQNERVEIWNKVLENSQYEYQIIIGARSSIFLPFTNLGLVIIDEEHESSYKQQDPSPRYNGRDAALYLATLFHAKVILGSATPSLESYANAMNGKYGMVTLETRYQGVELPTIHICNVKNEHSTRFDLTHVSTPLYQQIEACIENKQQVILFQNRRGYSPFWMCALCSWIPKCHQCDVTLTYHKTANHLKCHYCGYHTQPLGSCKACGSDRLQMHGFGTQKIEDEIEKLFPLAKIGRMDLDTTRSKNSYATLIQQFENKEIDILIGTQMLSKGLDFDNVFLVGVLDADFMLNLPDFRAYERAFQMLTQVSGRAGRKKSGGKVIIQTKQPDHWILSLVLTHNHKAFLDHEWVERKNFNYPPNTKLINLTISHNDENLLNAGAETLGKLLKSAFDYRVIGPEFPLIRKIQNKYLKTIKIKYEKSISDKKIKERLLTLLDSFNQHVHYKSIRISIDVDPY
jgi:primosomal protein N' (replication factor Y)